MSKQQEEVHKDLLNYVFDEFSKAVNDAKNGISPTDSYSKLKKIYDALYEAETKRNNNEISDEEMQNELAVQVEKLKQDI